MLVLVNLDAYQNWTFMSISLLAGSQCSSLSETLASQVNDFEGDNFEGFNGDDSPSISLISLLVFCQRTLFSKIGLGDDDFWFPLLPTHALC